MQTGTYIQDGAVTWIVTDIRDGAMVGDIVLRETLREGYVKANGAQVAASDYPRLVTYAVDNGLTVADDTAWNADKSKYVYDEANNTLRLPDAVGLVLQGGNTVASVEAGLPNITGNAGFPSYVISYHNGAFTGSYQDTGAVTPAGNSSLNQRVNLVFSASKSNDIYGRSTTVQPPALAMIPQIKY